MNEKKLKTITLTELRAQCTRLLSGHKPRTARSWLEDMLASTAVDMPLDRYSSGPAIRELEQEVATLLGKEAAVFVHKGVVAQQMALRVWADRSHIRNIALHPKSHIDLDENNAYERLHNLAGVRVGKDFSPFTLAELEALHQPLGAIVVELPLRWAGYKLPTWEELVAISDWAREQKVPLHFDGARLWESAPFYERSLAEIAALADSVYVSFYKGLGGMGGCILAGPQDFIDEAQVWKTRLGGDFFTIFPFIITATEGLQHHLPKMPAYYARAKEIAAALVEIPGVTISPNPPHTNAFQIYLERPSASLSKAAFKIAEAEQVWLFNFFEPSVLPGFTMSEVSVGEATEEWQTDEIVTAIRKLLALSKKKI